MTGTTSSGMTGTRDNFDFSFNNSGDNVVIKIQPIINSYRQGSPSWVVRCVETGEVWLSQRAAALAKNIPESLISKHLNGLHEDAHGYHFERIALAA